MQIILFYGVLKMHRMRHIATSDKSSVFLTAEFENKIYAWDLDGYRKISEFDSVLDFGGRRLALSSDGKTCVAAAYLRYGICLYDTETGNKIWHRRDIKQTQRIKFSPDGKEIYASIESKPMVVLNSSDGSDIKKLRATTNVYFNLFGVPDAYEKSRKILNYGDAKIESPTFAFLDVCPVPSGFVISAPNSKLISYNANGNINWDITPKQGEHFVNIGYCEKANIINAVIYKYNDPREKPYNVLYGLHADNGEIIYQLGLPDEAVPQGFGFSQHGERLICTSGEVYELSCANPRLIYKFNRE
jgi:hypothetical protein